MSGTQGLSVSDVVNVSINMAPLAIPLRNFGALCIAGSSPVIDPVERIREYTTLDQVVQDFGSTAPEYLAADLFFSQQPQPSICYIGRFAQTNTSAVLHGGGFTAAQASTLLTQLNAVTNGTMRLTIDGTVVSAAATSGALIGASFSPTDQATLLTTLQSTSAGAFSITIDATARDTGAINFTGAASLTAAAALIQTAMTTWATVTWNAQSGNFVITSKTTGATSIVSFAGAPATGTNISATLRLTAATSAVTVAGAAGMNFSSVTNLNGAASIIDLALPTASCVWDGSRFTIRSNSSGITSTITYASPSGSGTDISNLLKLSQTGGASAPVNGMVAETPLACATALRAFPVWYGLMFATPTPIADADHIAVAQFIEGCDPTSIYGYTTQNTNALDPTVTTDLSSSLKSMVLQRTFGQYSSSSPYAVASMYARAFTVDFEASNTTITLKFKQEPGVTGEILTETQAQTLNAKNCNVFVFYSNGAAIIQQGVMAGGYFFDERHGMDWQANRIQTDVFNVLYQAPTKIPQTDAGVHILVATVTNSLIQGVTNGLIAPGQWNAPGFGQLHFGDALPLGFYVYAPLVASQPQTIREQRIAPTIQCAMKLAGAVHFSDVIVNVNR